MRLSDDPDELSSEVTALEGLRRGQRGSDLCGWIYRRAASSQVVDPEIRINQNPFSAQYDRLGYGRVEVFTKPGRTNFTAVQSGRG